MNCNGDTNVTDDSVICLDISQDFLIPDDDGNEINASRQVIFDKTLPPGAAPDGFIILDESIETNTDDNNESSQEKDLPMFKVMFKDKTVLQQYEKEVKDFFQQLVTVDSTDVDCNGTEVVLKIWGNPKVEVMKNICNNTNNINIKNNFLFTIDNTPGSHDKYNIPNYGTKFERVLKTYVDSDDDSKNEKTAPRLNCFNCLGDHNLRDCHEPRNQIEINKNRNNFNVRTGLRNTRYHVDDDQRFKPGVLSAELRKALGLDDDELPKHIFKMRLIGYPPGWLEEAKLEHSGLNLYNSDGNRELDPTEEAGEIFTPESKAQYHIHKVHDFPGFNIPAPPGTHDVYWHADQQLFHSKETMLKMLSSYKADEGYKRKKLKISTGESSPNDITESVKMDVQELKDELNESTISLKLNESSSSIDSVAVTKNLSVVCEEIDVPSSKLIPVDSSEIVLRTDSPSLSDLERKKKLLLEALDDSNLQSNPATPLKSGLESSIFETPKSTNIITSRCKSGSNSSTPKHGSVMSVELGTPILQNTSRYIKLPSSENFSKDICDVINYENLPGATGSYDKISEILQKVRDTVGNVDDN